MGICLFVAGYV